MKREGLVISTGTNIWNQPKYVKVSITVGNRPQKISCAYEGV